MSDSCYIELDKMIKEYEEDSKIIKSDKLIMKNYPKLFVMSSASLFERNIKNRCQDFLDNPKNPIDTAYPFLQRVISRSGNKPVVDRMFAELRGYEDNGIEVLCADRFYKLFDRLDRQMFKQSIKTEFGAVLTQKIEKTVGMIEQLGFLINEDEKYELDYARQCELKEKLERSSFDIAEKAYLSIKLRRNRVAHNYLSGLSDSFNDVRDFYYDAVLYVIALERALEELTEVIT